MRLRRNLVPARPWVHYRKALRSLRGLQTPVIDFVIIGSAKCGTTSLHKYLNLHPDVYMPTGVGINDETGLFLPHNDDRIKALKSRRIREHSDDEALLEMILQGYRGERVVGEETTDYTKRPYRTVRYDFIKTHNPQMKFIFMVRDPIQKLFSQYRHFLRYQPKHTLRDFTQELLEYDYYKYASAYFFQLEPYIEHFGSQAIKVVILEELGKDTPRVLKSIFGYLGVSEIDVDPSKLERHLVNKRVSDLGLRLDSIPMFVRDFIRNDTEKFQRFLGRDLRSVWPSLEEV